MRIIVLGGTRFIGRATVRRLHELGHEVLVFHRGETEAEDLSSVTHLHGDRRRLPDYAAEFARWSPDAALDMLPMSEQDARLVTTTFQGIARRLVAVSSMDVYRAYGRVNQTEPGPPDPVPLREDAPLREHLFPYRGKREHLYDYEKILVERVVMGERSLPGTVIRLPMVYGPGDYQHRLFPYLKRMDDRRPAIVLEDGVARLRTTRGYVEDMAAAIALAVTDERAAGRIYNAGEAEPSAETAWVRAIARVTGWGGKVAIIDRDRLPPALRWSIDPNQDLVADSTRIRSELGYAEVTAPDEAMRRTVAWERANPPEQIEAGSFDYAEEDAALASSP